MIFHPNTNIGHTIGFHVYLNIHNEICINDIAGTKTAGEYKMPYGDHRTAILEQEPAMICDAIDIVYSIYIYCDDFRDPPDSSHLGAGHILYSISGNDTEK